ncbi:MAG: archease [Thaumarchaeota archaeon]|nr:archease [Nitrososphaerota archaeon]
MPYRLLPDVALADIAFEAESKTKAGLFESCARAMTDVMVDRRGVRRKVEKTLTLAGDSLDRLLYDFLTELIIMKDVDSLLFRDIRVVVAGDDRSLSAILRGEPIDRKRHALRNDVKAVTMHMFGVKKHGGTWTTTVVLDI